MGLGLRVSGRVGKSESIVDFGIIMGFVATKKNTKYRQPYLLTYTIYMFSAVASILFTKAAVFSTGISLSLFMTVFEGKTVLLFVSVL